MKKILLVLLAAHIVFLSAGCGFGDAVDRFTSPRSSSVESKDAASGAPSSSSGSTPAAEQAPGADLVGEPDGSGALPAQDGAQHPQENRFYLLMNTPGLTGSIRFKSDGTFELFAGPHNSEGAGYNGTYSVETPQKYILKANERYAFYNSEPADETFTALIEDGKIIVTRDTPPAEAGTAFNEMVFYIPSDRVVEPDIVEDPESTAETTEVLNIRMGPGTDYDIILETNAYDTVNIKGRQSGSDEWVYIQYGDNITGWVNTQWLSGETIVNTIAASRASIINPRFKFSITVPSNWTEGANSDNGDGFVIECGNDVKMSAYGEYAVLPQEFYVGGANGEIVEQFSFDSDVQGWHIQKSGEYAKYLYRTGAVGSSSARYTTYYIDYTKNPQWFSDNRQIIQEAARSLKNTE